MSGQRPWMSSQLWIEENERAFGCEYHIFEQMKCRGGIVLY